MGNTESNESKRRRSSEEDSARRQRENSATAVWAATAMAAAGSAAAKLLSSSASCGRASYENHKQELEQIAAQEQKQFSFATLASATKDFHPDHKLGQGGFGPVFKGKLEDGREIAVKRLTHSSGQGKNKFANEAKLLARVQHRNVVNLLGYCAHGPEKLLVYEYVANESLDKHLFKSGRRDALDWKRRHDIITGVARGLLYLHEGSPSVITHRDIKAGNILLDDKWVPKIADFGMARLFPEDETHVNTRVAGTNGYMAPEYVMHGRPSPKADVYSFGVVILELISGQKNSSFNLMLDPENLLHWVKAVELTDEFEEDAGPTVVNCSGCFFSSYTDTALSLRTIIFPDRNSIYMTPLLVQRMPRNNESGCLSSSWCRSCGHSVSGNEQRECEHKAAGLACAIDSV